MADGPVNVFKPAAAYFGIVFGVGLLLGTVRTLWVAPRVGARIAELAEMPVMLLATALAARFVCRRFAAGDRAAARIAIGLLALGLLLAAELAVGVGLRRMTPMEVLTDRDPISGAAYYGSLVFFALAPRLVGRARGK